MVPIPLLACYRLTCNVETGPYGAEIASAAGWWARLLLDNTHEWVLPTEDVDNSVMVQNRHWKPLLSNQIVVKNENSLGIRVLDICKSVLRQPFGIIHGFYI